MSKTIPQARENRANATIIVIDSPLLVIRNCKYSFIWFNFLIKMHIKLHLDVEKQE